MLVFGRSVFTEQKKEEDQILESKNISQYVQNGYEISFIRSKFKQSLAIFSGVRNVYCEKDSEFC